MALPDDGLSTMSDFNQAAYAVSAFIAPALKAAAVGMQLVRTENCPADSNKVRFQKGGSFIAEGVNEGAVYLPTDANSDLNDTYVEVTAAKIAHVAPISYEALRFGGGGANLARVGDEQGKAFGRKFDADLTTLFDSITNVATATAGLDNAAIITAIYNIEKGLIPTDRLVGMIGARQIADLKLVVANSGAARYANPTQIGILNNALAQSNGFVANYLDIDLYKSTGFTTTGGDDQCAIWARDWGFCCATGGPVQTEVNRTGAGVANQVAGFSLHAASHVFYGLAVYHQQACTELRSDSGS